MNTGSRILRMKRRFPDSSKDRAMSPFESLHPRIGADRTSLSANAVSKSGKDSILTKQISKQNSMHLLASINDITLSTVPTPIRLSDQISDDDEDDYVLHDIPDDMVLKSSLAIEANIDLSPLTYILSEALHFGSDTNHPTECLYRELAKSFITWQFPPDTSATDVQHWKKLPPLTPSQRDRLLDTCWHTSSRADGSVPDMDRTGRNGLLSRITQWQVAFQSLSKQWLCGTVPCFYLRGVSATSLRMCCTHTHHTQTHPVCICIIHYCSVLLYEHMRDMGVRIHVLYAATSPPPPKDPPPMDRKTLTKILTENPLYIKGEVDIRIALDCIGAVCLSVETSSSYARVAAELPHLLAPKPFEFAVALQPAITVTPTYTNETPSKLPYTSTGRERAHTAHSNDMDMKRSASRFTMHIMGLLPSRSVQCVAMVLQELACDMISNRPDTTRPREHTAIPRRFRTSAVNDYDIDHSVLLTAEDKTPGGDVYAPHRDVSLVEVGAALNPFKLVTSEPQPSVGSLLGTAKVEDLADDVLKRAFNNRALASSLLRRAGESHERNDDDIDLQPGELYFTIRANASAQDFDFAYAADVSISDPMAVGNGRNRSDMEGLVVTDVVWTESMSSTEEPFDVYSISLPPRRGEHTPLYVRRGAVEEESVVLLE